MIRSLLIIQFLVVLSVSSPVARADTPAELAGQRYETIADQIGATCVMDLQCDAPLRCVDGACAEPQGMSGVTGEATPFVRVHGDEGLALYYLEVVTTASERQRGLMYRPWLLENWGMLFVFPEEQPRSFWMRNTYIPLDMVFVSADGIVVGVVENAEPLTEVSRAVEGSSRFVIELNAGEAQRRGIRAGVRCEILNFAESN